MPLHPDSIWDCSLAEWQDIAAQQGRSALLERLTFTSAYMNDAAGTLCRAVRRLDNDQCIMLLLVLTGALEDRAHSARRAE